MADLNRKLSSIIVRMLLRTCKFSVLQPLLVSKLLRIVANQLLMFYRRLRNNTGEYTIPPFMIYSITKKCNLNCTGCYAKIHQSNIGDELNKIQVDKLFSETETLGIGIIMLAGGEPLTRPDIINLCRVHSHLLFPIFTNGVLLTESFVYKMPFNVIPVISIEGNQIQTDNRRGDDLYKLLKTRFKYLYRRDVFWGVSITVTTDNILEVTSENFIKKLIRHGCKLFFYVEYVPINPDTDHLVLTEVDKKLLTQRTDEFSVNYPGLFIAFPGDEDKWGGCLAAGRGFVHIQADGSLEPCPFAPYSDVSIKNMSLGEALKSKFLSKIRKKHHLLHETKGGCALWENRDKVKQILDSDD